MRTQSSTLLLRRPTSCALHAKPQHLSALAQSRRFSNALTPLQTLTATRILPYPAKDVYNIIADIPSYPQFIPYCTSSTITSHSAPDPTTPAHRTWPATADLRIGYGPYDEVYRSRVYCDPYRILEAVAGEAEPTISPPHYHHHHHKNDDGSGGGGNGPSGSSPSSAAPTAAEIFTSLLARWSFRQFPYKPNPPPPTSAAVAAAAAGGGKKNNPQEGNANANPAHPRTEVSLLLEVRFASAVYSALSQAAAPKVAGILVDAFERRAREVLGPGHGPVEEATGGTETAGGAVT